MNPRYFEVAARAFEICEYCHAPEEAFNIAFEVEHIKPRAHGGTNERSNLALACRACNQFKGDAETGWDEVTQADAPLFNPRSDLWEEHFEVDTMTLEIIGSTPVGCAAVSRLQLNAPRQIAARKRWVKEGYYPWNLISAPK